MGKILSLVFMVAIFGSALADPKAGGSSQFYPGTGGWGRVAASVRTAPSRIYLYDGDGNQTVWMEIFGLGETQNKAFSVSNTTDALVVDARSIFAAGATSITIYFPDLDPVPLSGNRSVTSKITWEGPKGMQIRDYVFARTPEDRDWHDGGKLFTANLRRKRVSENVYAIPVAKRVFHRLDILSPGDPKDATGAFKLYRIETGNWQEIGTRKQARKNMPKLVFSASFEAGFAADLAGGRAEPVVTNAVELVAGKTGRGVKFSNKARSDLAWPVRGNLNPRRGTVAFWLKKELPRDGDKHTLFYCRGANNPGGGTLDFWTSGSAVVLERHDLDNWRDTLWIDWPSIGAGWHYYTITWDDEKTVFYVDGWIMPRYLDTRLNDDYSPMRNALLVSDRRTFDRKMKAFRTFHLGSRNGARAQKGVFDDVKIWSEALTRDEVLELARQSGVKESAQNAKAKTGRNIYEGPSEKVPGRITRTRLVQRIRPAVDAHFTKDNFSAVGRLSTNVLNGVAYLEAGGRTEDRFAIRLRIDAGKPLYVIEIDVPDDKRRSCEFLVQRSRNYYGDAVLESGLFCGGSLPNSNRMRTERYVYWTSDADVTLIASTISDYAPAAIAEIRIYETDGKLPACLPATRPSPKETPRRHFASYWEDPAINYDFGTDFRDPKAFGEMIDRCAAYMKFVGQDVLAFPACFYGGRLGENRYLIRDLQPGYLDAFMTRFDEEGLFVVPTVNQQVVPIQDGVVTRESMQDGSLHGTSIAIHSTGFPNWGGWHGTPPNFNVAHPDVQNEFARIVSDLAKEGKSHASFLGVALHLPTLNPMWFGSIESGYNDYCIDAFEKATGIKVPVDRKDPLRGKAYADWLKANAYEAWVSWRCDVVTGFYARLAKILEEARPDLKLWLNAIPIWSDEPSKLLQTNHTQKALLEAGFDVDRITARIPNVVVGLTGFPAWWENGIRHDQRFFNLSDGEVSGLRDWSIRANRFGVLRDKAGAWAHFHDIYRESDVGRQRIGLEVLSTDWLDEISWRVSTQHAIGSHALKPFAEALAGCDAQVLSCGGFLIGTLGMEPELSRFMREYRKLPAVKFADMPAPRGWVFRTADCDGRRWVYKLKTKYPYTLKVESTPLDSK